MNEVEWKYDAKYPEREKGIIYKLKYWFYVWGLRKTCPICESKLMQRGYERDFEVLLVCPNCHWNDYSPIEYKPKKRR